VVQPGWARGHMPASPVLPLEGAGRGGVRWPVSCVLRLCGPGLSLGSAPRCEIGNEIAPSVSVTDCARIASMSLKSTGRTSSTRNAFKCKRAIWLTYQSRVRTATHIAHSVPPCVSRAAAMQSASAGVLATREDT